VPPDTEQRKILTEMARTMRASGADMDQIAQALLRRSNSPIAAIRAVASGTGLGLGDAKWVVHRNLDPEVRAAAESLWDELIDAMTTFEQPPIDPNATR
jgi:ribosomal protein L7/L12